MNARDVAELIAHAKVIWPHTTWDVPAQVVASIWLDLLGDLPAEAVRATLLTLSGERFCPSPGALRAAVLDRINPDTTPDIDQAWLEVREGLHTYGRYSLPEQRRWSHPAVAAAVDSFGWMELCNSENPEAARAHFARYYGAAAHRMRPERAPTAVVGALERARNEYLALSEALALPEGDL